MITPFDDVQRIVLRGSNWLKARHFSLTFDGRSAPHFLERLKPACWPTPASQSSTDLQVSLGFSRRGLEHASVPKHVLANFALKAPAFYAGAALRAHRRLGLWGRDGPAAWPEAFSTTSLDAVLSLHATEQGDLGKAGKAIEVIAQAANVQIHELHEAARLTRPPEETDQNATWAHFGFRDGLAHVGIKGWTPPAKLKKSLPISQFEAGEFVLGYPQGSGANPWIAGPGPRVWPEELRDFFHNGSFGVLHQIEQDVTGFEKFLGKKPGGMEPEALRAKLCGRTAAGRPLAALQAEPTDDFSYAEDAEGFLCPFGSHVRRMNPRANDLPHAARVRPLIRRGMPYGSAVWGKDASLDEKRGLMGQFFCASIEDQYEHLVGQWADRVPLGSDDCGGARDPMFGAHDPEDGPFAIPREKDIPLIVLGMSPFTQTIGVAYLFYPGLATLQGIAEQSPWYARPKEDT
jgi:deferrochelatase/peroxidase EfeB